MRPYPKLMCSRESPDSLIVYFSTPNSGMIVHSTVPEKPLGIIYRDWATDDFQDVADDVVIWLTEGPHDLIEEAIETVEKVRALRTQDDYNGTSAYPDEN